LGGWDKECAASARTLDRMNPQPLDTDTHLLDSRDVTPLTGEHHLRPPVTLEVEPPQGVPVWEPDAGDYA
jgi:hypothetical protein